MLITPQPSELIAPRPSALEREATRIATANEKTIPTFANVRSA
jgi:hypothetical protein